MLMVAVAGAVLAALIAFWWWWTDVASTNHTMDGVE